jgi:2-polyprenyl-3-methyl-5-hydroxy-6-metoxy-1,4-benzoquinol methylase
VCGSAEKKPLYRQAFARVEGVSFLDGYDVVLCGNCGFAFADGIPAQADFDAYYERQSKYERQFGAMSPAERDTVEKDSRFLARYVTDKAARILEIGCGSGNFLRQLQQEGYRDLSALEPAPACVRYLRDSVGVNAVTGSVSQPVADRAYDVVVALTVLEHVVDLNTTAANLARLVRPGGLLSVRVPDADRFAAYDDSPFQQFSPEHINYFTAVSIGNLLGKHGFRLLESAAVAMTETDNALLPMLQLMFARAADAPRAGFVRDDAVRKNLEAYVRASAARENGVNEVLSRLAATGEPIVVWGVGTHTLRLLESGALGTCAIVAFIDSNPHYAGGLFRGIPVVAPAELSKYPQRVLVSSKVYQNEIACHIKDVLGAANDLILLY